MRKIVLGLLMLTAFVTTKTKAQVKDNLSLGPIVGFGHNWISNYNGVEKKFKPSLSMGGRLLYSATPEFGVGLDAAFRTEGVKLEAGVSDISISTNYIRLDPKLFYFFGKYGQALRPKIGIGPGFGFLAGGKIKGINNGITTEAQKSKEIRKGFDVGLSGSLGFNYRLKSKTWLNADATYNHGISDIARNNPLNAIQNRSLFLNVGVTFGIGHAGSK